MESSNTCPQCKQSGLSECQIRRHLDSHCIDDSASNELDLVDDQMGNTSLSSDEMASILGPPSKADMGNVSFSSDMMVGTFEPPSEADMGDISLSSDIIVCTFPRLIWAISHSLLM